MRLPLFILKILSALKKKLYLDIDGVLLTCKRTAPADGAIEFIAYVVNTFDCYWLTTHCKGGVNKAVHYLAAYFDNPTLQLLAQVKPAYWDALKTEAIDFTLDFVWLEDYPFEAERAVLVLNNCPENLIVVDLNNKDELKRVTAILKNR